MKTLYFTAGLLVLWLLSLWIAFWLGFLKSQEVSFVSRRLDDQRVLLDQRVMLEQLKEGSVTLVQANLARRVDIGEKSARLMQPAPYGFVESLSYALYPREALTLLEVARLQAERAGRNDSQENAR